MTDTVCANQLQIRYMFLKKLLNTHFQIGSAMDTHIRYPHQSQPVQINIGLKPVVCSVQKWRPLVLALGLTVEEPDRNIDVTLCGVFVDSDCQMALLQWTKEVLMTMLGQYMQGCLLSIFCFEQT